MTTIRSIEDPEAARRYLSDVQVFGRSADFENLGTGGPPAPDYQPDTAQVVTVGSQIAEFAKGIPQELRPQIADSFLLAQLAANRSTADGGDSQDWYDRYVEVLANVGWLVETESFTKRDISGSHLRVHEEIIPVIATVLGPAVAAAAMVTTVLQSLANMEKDSPWITLFDRETQRAQANQFQISYADVADGGAPRIALACFEFDASRSVTQVLFFKFSDSQATLRNAGARLGMNPGVFEAVGDVVRAKVAEYVTNYVGAVEI